MNITIGYRMQVVDAAAPLHEVSVTIPDRDYELEPEMIAEHAFVATNSPAVVVSAMAQEIRDALYEIGYNGSPAHYSVSKFDRVSVLGVTLECGSFGWTRIV